MFRRNVGSYKNHAASPQKTAFFQSHRRKKETSDLTSRTWFAKLMFNNPLNHGNGSIFILPASSIFKGTYN
jgi:hypothetical protein